MPSNVRPRGSGTGGRVPPVTPMSERQQMALLMQMTSPGNQDRGSRSPSSGSGSSSATARARDRNERGETPLHVAAIKGDVEQVSKLLAHRHDPNATDFAGWTPLHEACNRGWLEVAAKLVASGANINAQGLDDDTPLHDAASNGHIRLVKLLVERGADIYAKNKRGKTPVDVAAAGVVQYLLNPSLPVTESSGNPRVQPRARDDKKITQSNQSSDSQSKKCSSPPSTTAAAAASSMDSTKSSQSQAAAAVSTSSNPPPDDVYEFKTSKETSSASSTGTASPAEQKNTDTLDTSTENQDNTTTNTDGKDNKTNPDDQSGTKRSFQDVGDSNETEPDDENKRKKRKDTDNKEKSGGTPVRNVGQTGKTTGKPSPAATKSNTLTAAKSSSDRKSPVPSPKPASSSTTNVSSNTSNAESEQDDAKPEGLKVPPLKIVIPQSSNTDSQDGQGSNRNGKSGSQRQHSLPYVVASSSGESTDKDSGNAASPGTDSNSGQTSTGKDEKSKDGNFSSGTTGDDQKGHHQRVLRSSHRGGPSGQTSADRSNNSSPLMQQRSHSPSPNSSPQAPASQQTENTNSNSNQQQQQKPASETQKSSVDIKSENTPTSGTQTAPTTTASASVELHPRKRKMRPSKETQQTAPTPHEPPEPPAVSEVHPHEQPITNCYQLYLNIRKQIEKRRKSLFPVQPKPPHGFRDYLINRCTYVLAGTAPTVPNINPPASLPTHMFELFTEQEKERYRLRMQHMIEKEKLVLSVEQEILRVHGRAARALANQTLPFSVCTVLRDEEVYNIITPEQEEKNNQRSRYNGRLFLSWLQDVDDKWEKIKEAMVIRHHNEAESLHAVQKMDWEWKLKELSLCEFNATPHIDETHVPMVNVSDDFDLLPP